MFQRADGRWVAQVSYRGPDGKRKRPKRTADTQREAADLLHELRTLAHDGTIAMDRTVTVAGWLVGEWADLNRGRVEAGELTESTAIFYAGNVSRHVVPAIGAVKLVDLKPIHVHRIYRAMRDQGLAASTITRVRSTLSKALNDARQAGLDVTNVARDVPPPRDRDDEGTEWVGLEPDQVRYLLDHLTAQRPAGWIAFNLMVTVGLRFGEATGLRWVDVDLDAGTLTVNQQARRVGGELRFTPPKSKRSRRTLTLPTATRAALTAWRTEQTTRRLAAATWTSTGLVATTGVGTCWESSNLWRSWRKVRTVVGLGNDVRLHDLRHTAATLRAADGAIGPELALLLGHADGGALAMLTYVDPLRSTAERSAERFDRMLGGAS